MKNLIKKTVAAIALAASLFGTAPSALGDEEPTRTVFLVLENGGTATDAEGLQETLRQTLGELSKIFRRRAARETEIVIISTADPTTAFWSGPVKDLKGHARLILEAAAVRNTCSDLLMAYDEVDTLRQIIAPDEHWIIHVGGLIHAGFPCHEDEAAITVPQPAPPGLKLGQLAADAALVRLLHVHPDQDPVYLGVMKSAGVVEKGHSGTLDFDLRDVERTRSAYGKLLK